MSIEFAGMLFSNGREALHACAADFLTAHGSNKAADIARYTETDAELAVECVEEWDIADDLEEWGETVESLASAIGDARERFVAEAAEDEDA